MASTLTTSNHDRDVAGLKYVYPVLSRRAGGLSIGINFNTNNACNWRCIYCQVPDLKIGAAPEMNFQLLEQELRYFLDDVLNGDFYQRFQVDENKRTIKDIAISGNGEPTSLKNKVCFSADEPETSMPGNGLVSTGVAAAEPLEPIRSAAVTTSAAVLSFLGSFLQPATKALATKQTASNFVKFFNRIRTLAL